MSTPFEAIENVPLKDAFGESLADAVVAPLVEHVELIHYVMDLEALVRWCALAYAYEDQEGVRHQNEPIWTVHDEKGNYLPENDRLQRTWNRVFHPEDGS